jgi:hypothetical protein
MFSKRTKLTSILFIMQTYHMFFPVEQPEKIYSPLSFFIMMNTLHKAFTLNYQKKENISKILITSGIASIDNWRGKCLYIHVQKQLISKEIHSAEHDIYMNIRPPKCQCWLCYCYLLVICCLFWIPYNGTI